MYKHFFVILIIGALLSFLWGVYDIFTQIHSNQCRMTYMFEMPQFLRIKFNKNDLHPSYGLYYYYEGTILKDLSKLNGAPVIFVPGNAGSYKQVRSLASVALRKSMDNYQNIHLDYFTIDYDEELSGLFGGYLDRQMEFLRNAINAVLDLYENQGKTNIKVVLIGHSMGGKIAQAVLADSSSANLINTVLSISTPLDKPVVYFDAAISDFYERANTFLSKYRRPYMPGNETNCCHSLIQMPNTFDSSTSYLLENVLLISVGGGEHDLLVRAGLTTSRYSDIHAMTTAVPKVWLSCDHLSVVWCLQFVLAVNRFLFNILLKGSHNRISFQNDKSLRLQAAENYFLKSQSRPHAEEIDLIRSKNGNVWSTTSKRIVHKKFVNGLKQIYNHMISLEKCGKLKKVYLEVVNADETNWLYGCAAQISPSGDYCKKALSISHHIRRVPFGNDVRSVAVLDLNNIKNTYSNWTHIVVRIPPTHKQVTFSIDVHDPVERYLRIRAPRWYMLKEKHIIEETLQGTVYYKLLIHEISQSYYAMQINLNKQACTGPSYRVTTKICVPWARGFDKYQVLTKSSQSSVLLNVPINSPPGYNTTANPITIELFLDPNCRFSISYSFSISKTISSIVLEFYHWLPAHLTAVLCIILRNHMKKIDTENPFKYSKPYSEFFQYISLYIVTGCRIFKKILQSTNLLAVTDISNPSICIGVIVHSTAIAFSIILSIGVWMFLVFQGNLAHKLISRTLNATLFTTTVIVSVFNYVPLTIGVLLIAIAVGSCSGVSLFLACLFYLIKLSSAYKDYLEDWLCEGRLQLHDTSVGQLKSSVVSEQPANSEYIEFESVGNKQSDKGSKYNFGYHITLLLLLFVLALLNSLSTIAWAKTYRTDGVHLHQTSLTTTVVVLACLSFMWQLKAPYSRFGCTFLSIILYACASASVLYCQEKVYRLNYVITIVYVAVFLQVMLSKLWRIFVDRK